VRNAFVAAKKRPGGIHLALNHRFGVTSDFHRPYILIWSSDTPFVAHVVAIPILNECEAYWVSSIPKVCKHFFITDVN
jgi:hypothetical protein